VKFVVFSLFSFIILKIGLLISFSFYFITFVLPRKKEEDDVMGEKSRYDIAFKEVLM